MLLRILIETTTPRPRVSRSSINSDNTSNDDGIHNGDPKALGEREDTHDYDTWYREHIRKKKAEEDAKEAKRGLGSKALRFARRSFIDSASALKGM